MAQLNDHALPISCTQFEYMCTLLLVVTFAVEIGHFGRDVGDVDGCARRVLQQELLFLDAVA